MRDARVEMLALGQDVEAFAAGDPKGFCHKRCSDAAAAMACLHRHGGDVRLYLTVAQHADEADVGIPPFRGGIA